jgi:hypothetical protein
VHSAQQVDVSLDHPELEDVRPLLPRHRPEKTAEEPGEIAVDEPRAPPGGPDQVDVQPVPHRANLVAEGGRPNTSCAARRDLSRVLDDRDRSRGSALRGCTTVTRRYRRSATHQNLTAAEKSSLDGGHRAAD